MNILDVKKLEYIPKQVIEWNDVRQDRLAKMFAIQDTLRQRYGIPVQSIHCRDGQKNIRDMAFNVVQELCEAINLLKTHEWTTDEKIVDINHYREEVADFLCFTIEWLILSGLTADDIFEIYTKKAEVNFFRIASKY